MRVLIACALLLGAACGPNARITPGNAYGGGASCYKSDGILLIDWTVRGALPGMQSCSGISKLTLFLDNTICGQVEIDPISCALDKFRYDDLPDGDAEVVLQGYDANGLLAISGSAAVTLTATLPAKPTTVALH